MFETPITIVGNVVTDPVHRQVGEHEVFKFRMASNSRRKTGEGTWETADTLFVSVTCWGRLVSGAAAALVKGDPVIVVGNICTSEYEKDGVPRTSVDLRATAIGPDLTRCNVRIDRTKRQIEAPRSEPTDENSEDVEDSAEELSLTA